MEITEAADIIEALTRSIKEYPSQFHFEISITGTQITSYGGGTGLSVQAIGGESGSQTIGFQSTVGGQNIEISQKAANSAIQQAMSKIVEILENLVSELRSTTPNKGRVNNILDSLKQSWIPNMITSIAASIIAKVALS